MTTTTATTDSENVVPQKPEPIRININPRYYQIPGAALLVGTAIGVARGSRRAGLRFQAENAHRPPKTLQGWYYYKKTKNYRMMLGGLQQGGKTASQLGLTAVAWVGMEEACIRCGLEDFRELGAGLITSGLFSALCKFRVTNDILDALLTEYLHRPITIQDDTTGYGARSACRRYDAGASVRARKIEGTNGWRGGWRGRRGVGGG